MVIFMGNRKRTDPRMKFSLTGLLGYTRFRTDCYYNQMTIPRRKGSSYRSQSSMSGMSDFCGLRTSVKTFPMYVALPRSEYYA